MPSLSSYHTIASTSDSITISASSRLSSTPPQQSTTSAATSFTPPSPKSVVPPQAGPNLAATAASSRQYYQRAVSTSRSAPGNPTSSHLPRISSLLPPPRIAPGTHTQSDSQPDSGSGNTRPTFQDPFNAQPTQSLHDLEPLPPRRPSSRSSSAGGLSDSFRNLNRWSASTTSSGASPGPGHRRNTSSSSRRASLGIFGFVHSSPKKLQKHQQSSLSGESPRSQAATRVLQESVSSVPPLQTLPHIATLPSLDLEPPIVGRRQQAASAIQPARSAASNSRTNDEISADYWDGPAAAPDETALWTAPTGNRPATHFRDYSSGEPTMPYHNGETRGHSRNRSTGAKGSADSTSSVHNRDRERERERERAKQPSQKAMLSKALQKANTAVQLDNAQNPEAARQAYAEACGLLQQVLQRTGGDEDRRKLEAIRETYTKRIDELDQLLPPDEIQEEKALPRRPVSLDRPESMVATASDSEDAIVETATVTRIIREETDMRWSPAMPSYSVPISAARRQYSTPQLSIATSRDDPSAMPGQYSLQSSFSRSPMRADSSSSSTGLQPPMFDSHYMPPPLSPRRPLSPVRAPEREADPAPRGDFSAYTSRLAPAAGSRGHRRDNSHESVSWLDPIEESGGSTASSVHSRSSSVGIRRKHIRAPSGETEAEFDAALDDAIEAAYNEGYEPDDAVDPGDSGMGAYREENADDAMASVFKRVELAREAVRASEREAMIWASEREKRLRLQQEEEDEMARLQEHEQEQQGQGMEDFYDGNTSDEEERFLEEMRKEYAIEDFTFTAAQKQASVPRESDSSGLTSRTWHSSMGSNPPLSTSTTLLTTVSESTVTSVYTKPPSQPPAPPSQALPQLPPQPQSAGSQSSSNSTSQGVRSRRLSGQNAKQLKIETSKVHPPGPAPATAGPTQTQQKSGGYIVQQRQALSAGVHKTAGPFSARHAPSPAPGAGPGDAGTATGTPSLPSALTQEIDGRSGSPSVSPPGLRKKFSSSSLRNMKSRNMSVSHIDDASDNMSPGTPLSNGFGLGGSQTRLPAMPALPTPLAAAFKDRMNNTSTGGLYLFDNDIHSPQGSTSSNPLVSDAPVPLEPCPTDSMLRPFWLMRCLYQTLCHPRGGYISNKLFVPRDVWRVKGVKLKSIEDKMANCDYLTAALQKLAKVDNCDADAVLEEMQTLEGVLEQVQAALTRKLGNEVGVHGANNLFREASTADGEPSSSTVPRSASVSGKSSSAFSWRRLRGKNSSAGLSTAYAGKGGSGGALSTAPTLVEGAVSAKDAVVPSLPMTSHPTSRPTKRDISSVQFGGPNANYMSALARLFDAAQTVDQIARQVEDPGLRHADKTQVGLELCTRHAAEFFGFYICRFVLADLTMLLDKFIKRGSEWVLA